jgi:hypothetical protein
MLAKFSASKWHQKEYFNAVQDAIWHQQKRKRPPSGGLLRIEMSSELDE